MAQVNTPHAPALGTQTVIPDVESLLAARRKRWTRDECRRLMETGALPEGRFELIEGDIIPKMGQNQPHVRAIMRALQALMAVFGIDFLQIQAPLAISEHNEPEPDLIVTRQPTERYLTLGTPTPQDVQLIVEVSDSTLAADRTGKADMYGRTGVPELWVVNINARTLEVFRQPSATGYAQTFTISENDTISPLAAPGASVRVADLLP